MRGQNNYEHEPNSYNPNSSYIPNSSLTNSAGFSANPPSTLNSMQVNMMGATGLNPMGQAAQMPIN